jgi:Tol biopolymer transport system component
MRTPLVASCIVALAAFSPATHLSAQSAPRVLASFTGPQSDDEAPSPDGRLLARSYGKKLMIYDITTHRETQVAPVAAWELAWSPSGEGLAFVRGDDAGEDEFVWYVPVDRATGRPTAAPHRVTLTKGEFPAISNDGKSIAYSAPDTNGGRQIRIVPVKGGSERTVARVRAGIEALNWIAGDKSLVFDGPIPGAAKSGFGTIGVNVRTGAQRLIGPPKVWLVGMTRDHLHMIAVPASSPVKLSDRAIMMDTAGNVLGRAPLPNGEVSEYSGVIGDSSLVWIQLVDHKTIEIAPTGGGKATRLPLIGRSNLFPTWSRDGKQLSYLVQDDGRYQLAVVGADGRSPRVYKNTALRPGEWTVAWSPDGRTLAYEGADTHSIWLLDLASGNTRRIHYDSTHVPGLMRFLADGKTIRFTAGRGGVAWSGTMNEVTTSGQSRVLAQVDAITGIRVLGDDQVYLRGDSVVEISDASFGNRRRVGTPQTGTRIWAPGHSADGSMVVGRLTALSGAPTGQIEITDARAATTRVMDVPFTMDNFTHFPVIRPDNKAVLLFGKQAGDSTTKLYELPLDGSSARVLADVGVIPRDASVSMAPDGAHVAYSVQPDYSTRNLLVIPVPRTGARTSRGGKR